jgi:hypothetical protein
MNAKIPLICQDCIVLAGGMSLEYADGSAADTTKGIYNHHLTISAMGKPSKMMICPGSRSMPSMPMTPLLGTASDGSSQVYLIPSLACREPADIQSCILPTMAISTPDFLSRKDKRTL